MVEGPFENVGDAVRRAAEHHQQHIDVHLHELRRLFTELNKEHLSTLTDFLGNLSTSGDQAAGTAAHFYGIGKVYLESRFNVCSACGVDHDQAAKDLKDKAASDGQMELPFPHQVHAYAHQNLPDESKPFVYKDLPEHVKQFMEDAELTGIDFGPFLQIGETGRLNLPQAKMMEAYHLDDLREEGTNKLLGFRCTKGCDGNYQTIEDRMRKSPDDCHFCQSKSAWG